MALVYKDLSSAKIAIIGLGYVGLPLAVEFSKKFPTIGFDIDAKRIDELRAHDDQTLEVSSQELAASPNLSFASQAADIADCNIFIVTVPTPIDEFNQPNMGPLRAASQTLGNILSKNDLVIYESTVYPGATEEVCIPVIESFSGLKYNKDFFAGYSPERINPGDKEHRLPSITKVTSGSTPEVAEFVDKLYSSIITAGTHPAPSIRVAEAAKVIENTQRDLNIALINELALIFERLELDTREVLAAAGTKWNFLNFQPGLVGGHCIGVDPYYLTHKAEEIGYHPEVILAGRRINDRMGEHIADRVIKLMIQEKINVIDANVLVMGLVFKENCPDLRNTRVIDVIDTLESYNTEVDVYDPWADAEQTKAEYGIELVQDIKNKRYDAIIVAVAHQQFIDFAKKQGLSCLGNDKHIIFDVKGILPRDPKIARL